MQTSNARIKKGAVAHKPVQVIAVSGGKGGIGKTNVSVNLACCLARLGKKVVLLDADLGLANVDVLLGLKPQNNLSHVIEGHCHLDDILIEGPAGIKIIPSSSGTQMMTQLTPLAHAGLINAFSDLEQELDILLIDVAAGISESVVCFCRAAQEVIIVVCDEPTSITDAYAMIKILHLEYRMKKFHVLANMVETEESGKRVYLKLLNATDKFLDVNLNFVGAIPFDSNLRRAVQQQKAIVDKYPSSAASLAFQRIAKNVIAWPKQETAGEHVSFFLERLIQ